MKIYSAIALIGVVILCTACPERRYVSDLKKIQDNNMDLPGLEREYYKGITYMLSDLFSYDYNEDYVITEDADTKIIHDIELNFSVEVFSADDAELIQYEFDSEISLLDAVHDNYILKRKASLYEEQTSIKKELPKSVDYDGYIQIVHGSTYSYDDGSSYFTATLEIDGNYFVFQMIGKRENMGYLYDDFIDLLSSVEG